MALRRCTRLARATGRFAGLLAALAPLAPAAGQVQRPPAAPPAAPPPVRAPSAPAASPGPLEPPPAVVSAGERGWLLLPAQLVATGRAQQVEWSSDGRYALALLEELRFSGEGLQPPRRFLRLVLWDHVRAGARELWAGEGDAANARLLAWFEGAPVALAVLTQPAARAAAPDAAERNGWLVRIDAGRRTLQGLAPVPRETWLQALPCHARPVVLTTGWSDGVPRLVAPDGSLRPVPMPRAGLFAHEFRWGGREGALILATSEPIDSGRVRRHWFVWETTGAGGAGHWRPLFAQNPGEALSPEARARVEPPPAREAALPLELRADESRLVAPGGMFRVSALWLVAREPGEFGPALVALEAVQGRLAPDGRAVLYGDGNALWMRPLASVTVSQLRQMREAARRAAALSHAKQLGAALLMWAQDHDERLPSAAEDIGQLLLPYLKEDRLLYNFVYTYPGGRLSDIAEPSKTVVGHIPAPGGRVQLFADGHVVWEPDR